MIIAVFIIVGMLIFPIIASLYFYADFSFKKVYFAIFIFGKFRILSGYIKARDKSSVYIHISDKKAFIIDLTYVKKMSSNSNFSKMFNVDLVDVYIENSVLYPNITFVILSIYNVLIPLLSTLYELYGVKIILNCLFNNSKTILNSIKFKIRIQFNLFSIVLRVIANIISVGENDVKRKRIGFKKQKFNFA